MIACVYLFFSVSLHLCESMSVYVLKSMSVSVLPFCVRGVSWRSYGLVRGAGVKVKVYVWGADGRQTNACFHSGKEEISRGI